MLTSEEITDLNRYLLEHTIDTLNQIPKIEQVLVTSHDAAALSLAREFGARTILENDSSNLNATLARATVVAKTYVTQGVLILPMDLPLLTPEDIMVMLDRVQEPPVVVVAPDKKKRGTNALLVCPAGLIDYQYGANSFQKHCELARQAGAQLEVCELPSLSLDLDDPDDLNELDSIFEMGVV
jgi:2-phospho-L-lactate guanylyltransferase